MVSILGGHEEEEQRLLNFFLLPDALEMWLGHQTTFQPGLIKQMGENAPASKDDSEDAGDNEMATEQRYSERHTERCRLQRRFFL